MKECEGMEKWTVIANPKAGSKRFFSRRKTIEEYLAAAGIEAEIIVTEYAGHAKSLAADLLENRGVRHLMVAGGDGTVSEVVDGIFSSSVDPSEVTMALLPGGTGNDWARYWGIPKNMQRSISFVKDAQTQWVDVGRLSFQVGGCPKEKFFINSVGFGYDAQVVYYAEVLARFLPGRAWLYSLAVLMGALMHSSKPLRLEADDDVSIDDKIYTMSIANGPYTGGGIKQTPDAVPTDGLFDVFVVVHPSLFSLVKSLYRLFKKTMRGNSCLRFFKTKQLHIECGHRQKVEADGITIEPSDGAYDLEILPKALRMIVPRGEAKNE